MPLEVLDAIFVKDYDENEDDEDEREEDDEVNDSSE